jgi:hypothetical protein
VRRLCARRRSAGAAAGADPQIRLLGGNNAQRDIVMQSLIGAAMRAGRRDAVTATIAHEAALPVTPTQRASYAAAARWLA